MILEHNVETGEVIEREMTTEEIARFEAEIATAKAEAETKAIKAVEKDALLVRLGITEDEAKLLLS